MKILHIHSDHKFISESINYYNSNTIHSDIVYLGRREDTSIDNIIVLPHSIKSYREIENLSKSYDIVVFFSLRLQHAMICNMLPPSIIVIWRFFGAELYPYIYKEMLSERSMTFYNKNRLHHILSKIKHLIYDGRTANTIFRNAVNRTDYFAGLADLEYKFLKKRFSYLPPFLQLPYTPVDSNQEVNMSLKENTIIIGHSKDIYVNHLDILSTIESSPCRNNYKYYMFFSYSEYSKKYSEAILKKVCDWPTMKAITDFLPFDEFNHIMNTASALVINSYRQMAMGNIFSAFRSGVKVYLSNNNLMLAWLLNHGFCVYSIEQLYEDINNHNITLTEEQMNNNIAAFKQLSKDYSVESLCYNLNRIV